MFYISLRTYLGAVLAQVILRDCRAVGASIILIRPTSFDKEEFSFPDYPCLVDSIERRHHQRWSRLKSTVRDPRGMLASVRNQSRDYNQRQRSQQKRKSGRRNGSQRGN